MSASSSSKSKIAKFSSIRLRVTDFGKTTSPRWMCQRSVTWAGLRPSRSAIRPMTGSSATLPRAIGDHASVTISWSASKARSSSWARNGLTSIWLTAGRDAPGARSRLRRWCGWKFGDADGLHPAAGVDLLHHLPAGHVVGHAGQRPVDEEEVEVVEAQVGQAAVERPQDVVALEPVVVQLAGDEDVLARRCRTRGRPGRPRARCRTSARCRCAGSRSPARTVVALTRVLGLDLEDAEPELRDLDAVVQGERGHGCHRGGPSDRGGRHAVGARPASRPATRGRRLPTPGPASQHGAGRPQVGEDDAGGAALEPRQPGRAAGARLGAHGPAHRGHVPLPPGGELLGDVGERLAEREQVVARPRDRGRRRPRARSPPGAPRACTERSRSSTSAGTGSPRRARNARTSSSSDGAGQRALQVGVHGRQPAVRADDGLRLEPEQELHVPVLVGLEARRLAQLRRGSR